jgi:hypothetical protein
MRLPNREGVAVPCPPEAPTLPTSAIRMGDPRAPRSQSQTWRTSPSSPNARDTERHLLLGAQGRMCLAIAPARLLLAVADRLPLLEGLAHGDGTWEQIHTALRERLRRLLGVESLPRARRSSTPRGPRPPTKEAHQATTVARKSAVESDICSSIRKVCSSG